MPIWSYSVLHCVAVCCSVREAQGICIGCSVLQCVAVRCNRRVYRARRVEAEHNVLQCVTMCCSALQLRTERYR